MHAQRHSTRGVAGQCACVGGSALGDDAPTVVAGGQGVGSVKGRHELQHAR